MGARTHTESTAIALALASTLAVAAGVQRLPGSPTT
jgi:hypothetical protein